MTLSDIIEDFKGYKFPSERMQLSQACTVVNQERFFNSHVSILKAHTGNWRFKPYFDRLVIFHQNTFKNE